LGELEKCLAQLSDAALEAGGANRLAVAEKLVQLKAM